LLLTRAVVSNFPNPDVRFGSKADVRFAPIATSIAKSDLGNPVIETGELGGSVLLSLLALAVPLSPSFLVRT